MEPTESDRQWGWDFIAKRISPVYYESSYLLKYLTDYANQKTRQKKNLLLVFTVISAFGIVGWFNLPEYSKFFVVVLAIIHGFFAVRNQLIMSDKSINDIRLVSNSILVYNQELNRLAQDISFESIGERLATKRLSDLSDELNSIAVKIQNYGNLESQTIKVNADSYADTQIRKMFKNHLK